VQLSIQIVYKLNETIFSSDFVARHRNKDTDFTRKRSLPLPHLISFMLNMVNSSIQTELHKFFQVVDDKLISSSVVTASAFCRARRKFSYSAFKELNSDLVDTFYKSPLVKRWNGFRLLAVDGSITNLPDNQEVDDYFGRARATSVRPSARLSQLFDVLNKISIDVEVSPVSVGERKQATAHLDHAKKDDLVLYDRGYPAVWLFIRHQQQGVNFCCRTPVDYSNQVNDFVKSKAKDKVVSFPCIEKSLKHCRKNGLPTQPISVRLVKVKLENGDTEVLMTSLFDKKKYPRKVFENLYHQRWFIEEDYKLMKSRLEMENFSGKSVEAVKQDIHAKALTKNIAAVAIAEADVFAQERCKKRKLKYKINFSYALSLLKDNIIRFTLGLITADVQRLLIDRISKVVHAIRPGRGFVRENKGVMRKRRKRYSMAYKRV